MTDYAGTTFIFIGRPGSGKGTQSELFLKNIKEAGYDVLRCTVGDLGRTLGARDTLIGRWVKDMIGKGEPFPSWLAFTLLLDELADSLKKQNQILILDGAPRRMFEATSLDDLMAVLSRPAARGFYLDISEEESRSRLAVRMRADDTPEAIGKRLSWFTTDVMPVIEYYGNRLTRISAQGTIEEISSAIMASVSV